MEGFKLKSETVTAEEALKAADELEQAVGEIFNGQRRAGEVPLEPMAVLVQFVRDAASSMAQLAADRDAFEAAGESARERLVLRMEELQQAVLARLAAEKQVAQLLAALEGVTLTQEQIDFGTLPGDQQHANARAVIAQMKGGAA